ncbi:unnamed protein product [Sphagnum tenellum]
MTDTGQPSPPNPTTPRAMDSQATTSSAMETPASPLSISRRRKHKQPLHLYLSPTPAQSLLPPTQPTTPTRPTVISLISVPEIVPAGAYQLTKHMPSYTKRAMAQGAIGGVLSLLRPITTFAYSTPTFYFGEDIIAPDFCQYLTKMDPEASVTFDQCNLEHPLFTTPLAVDIPENQYIQVIAGTRIPFIIHKINPRTDYLWFCLENADPNNCHIPLCPCSDYDHNHETATDLPINLDNPAFIEPILHIIPSEDFQQTQEITHNYTHMTLIKPTRATRGFQVVIRCSANRQTPHNTRFILRMLGIINQKPIHKDYELLALDITNSVNPPIYPPLSISGHISNLIRLKRLQNRLGLKIHTDCMTVTNSLVAAVNTNECLVSNDTSETPPHKNPTTSLHTALQHSPLLFDFSHHVAPHKDIILIHPDQDIEIISYTLGPIQIQDYLIVSLESAAPFTLPVRLPNHTLKQASAGEGRRLISSYEIIRSPRYKTEHIQLPTGFSVTKIYPTPEFSGFIVRFHQSNTDKYSPNSELNFRIQSVIDNKPHQQVSHVRIVPNIEDALKVPPPHRIPVPTHMLDNAPGEFETKSENASLKTPSDVSSIHSPSGFDSPDPGHFYTSDDENYEPFPGPDISEHPLRHHPGFRTAIFITPRLWARYDEVSDGLDRHPGLSNIPTFHTTSTQHTSLCFPKSTDVTQDQHGLVLAERTHRTNQTHTGSQHVR